jgi:hypothetical protein
MKPIIEAKLFNLKLKDSNGLRQNTTYSTVEATQFIHASCFPACSCVLTALRQENIQNVSVLQPHVYFCQLKRHESSLTHCSSHGFLMLKTASMNEAQR